MRYIKKPVEVEAFQWKKDKEPEWFKTAIDFGIIQHHTFDTGYPEELLILKKGKEVNSNYANDYEVNSAHTGDYIVKNQNNEIYPIKENIFLNTYEKIKE